MGIAQRLLFIEPQEPPSTQAVLDSFTRKMCAAFRRATTSPYAFGGVHSCRCGATSSCTDHFLPDGAVTNSLCIHYVAHHRNSVPDEQLRAIDAWAWGEAQPTEEELLGPELIAAGFSRMIERSLGSGLQVFRRWGLDTARLCSHMRSYKPDERENAQDLFDLLLNMKHLCRQLSEALGTSNENELAWGQRALRLPDWDRQSWLGPMIGILGTAGIDEGTRRLVAWQFRHFRKTKTSVPSALVELREASEGELKKAASLAIHRMSGD